MKKHYLFAFAAGTLLAGSLATAQPDPDLALVSEGMIASFSIIDAQTGEELLPLSYPGADPVINLADYPGIHAQLQANIGPSDYRGTVRFSLNGMVLNTDSTAPFVMEPSAGSAQFPLHTTYTACAATDDPADEGCIQFHLIHVEWGLTHLSLVDADRDVDVVNFLPWHDTAGYDPDRYSILDLTWLDKAHLISIRANTRPETVSYVWFGLNGDDYGWTENLPPYSLFGDIQGNYRGWAEVHQRRIGGSCFSEGAQQYLVVGVEGPDTSASYVAQFSFRYDRAATGFTLIDASNNAEIGPLFDGDTLQLSELPSRQLNVRAHTQPYWAPLLQMELTEQTASGTRYRKRFERIPPYAVFGDIGGDYVSWYAQPGTYTLTALPRPNTSDDAFLCGIPYTATFTVVESQPLLRSEQARNPLKAAVVPNPAPDGTWLQFTLEQSCHASLEVWDLQGKRLMRRAENAQAGPQQWRIETRNLAAGLYRVVLSAGSEHSTVNLVVP